MISLEDIAPQALSLAERDRARLAERLLSSLGPEQEEDDGTQEALRREHEAESDPSVLMTLEEFDAGLHLMLGR